MECFLVFGVFSAKFPGLSGSQGQKILNVFEVFLGVFAEENERPNYNRTEL